MSEPPDDVPTDPQPTIPAGDFVLRPWRPDDDLYVVKAFTDPAIHKWTERRIESPEQAAGWIERWATEWAARRAASWAIAPADDPDAVVGQVALRSLWVSEMAEVSYWVLPDHRGLGIAPRATRALANWAMREFDLSRLELVHSVRNRASCRVALKAGFAPEGIKRSLQKHGPDEVHDMHMHALVRPAQVRVRTLDTVVLGVASQVRLWLAVSAASAGLMALTLVSRLALLVPLLLAAGVLGVYATTAGRPRWRDERRARHVRAAAR
jgi:RimJ/RimL family protein N-acetyltransferase